MSLFSVRGNEEGTAHANETRLGALQPIKLPNDPAKAFGNLLLPSVGCNAIMAPTSLAVSTSTSSTVPTPSKAAPAPLPSGAHDASPPTRDNANANSRVCSSRGRRRSNNTVQRVDAAAARKAHRLWNHITPRMGYKELAVSPGWLGLIFVFNPGEASAVITAIDPTCTFRDKIQLGDRIISIDGRALTNSAELQIGKNRCRVFGIIPPPPSSYYNDAVLAQKEDKRTVRELVVPPCRIGLTLGFAHGEEGAVITAIDPKCAFRDKLQLGDRIVSIDGRKLTKSAELQIGKDRSRTFGIMPSPPPSYIDAVVAQNRLTANEQGAVVANVTANRAEIESHAYQKVNAAIGGSGNTNNHRTKHNTSTPAQTTQTTVMSLSVRGNQEGTAHADETVETVGALQPIKLLNDQAKAFGYPIECPVSSNLEMTTGEGYCGTPEFRHAYDLALKRIEGGEIASVGSPLTKLKKVEEVTPNAGKTAINSGCKTKLVSNLVAFGSLKPSPIKKLQKAKKVSLSPQKKQDDESASEDDSAALCKGMKKTKLVSNAMEPSPIKKLQKVNKVSLSPQKKQDDESASEDDSAALCKGMKKTKLYATKKNGEDYFDSEESLQTYARINLGWSTEFAALCRGQAQKSPQGSEMDRLAGEDIAAPLWPVKSVKCSGEIDIESVNPLKEPVVSKKESAFDKNEKHTEKRKYQKAVVYPALPTECAALCRGQAQKSPQGAEMDRLASEDIAAPLWPVKSVKCSGEIDIESVNPLKEPVVSKKESAFDKNEKHTEKRKYQKAFLQAQGFPSDWIVLKVPRPNYKHTDSYYYSPKEAYKFRSRPEVQRFLDCLKRVDGDEKLAFEALYSSLKMRVPTRAPAATQPTISTKQDMLLVGDSGTRSTRNISNPATAKLSKTSQHSPSKSHSNSWMVSLSTESVHNNNGHSMKADQSVSVDDSAALPLKTIEFTPEDVEPMSSPEKPSTPKTTKMKQMIRSTKDDPEVESFHNTSHQEVGEEESESEESAESSNTKETTNESSGSRKCHRTAPANTKEMPWSEMWSYMRSEGWSYKPGTGRVAWLYLHPTCKGMKKTELFLTKKKGEDYFESEESLQTHARLNLGWRSKNEAEHKNGEHIKKAPATSKTKSKSSGSTSKASTSKKTPWAQTKSKSPSHDTQDENIITSSEITLIKHRERHFYSSIKMIPRRDKFRKSDPLSQPTFNSNSNAPWCITIGDLVCVQHPSSYIKAPFTTSWRPCQILSLFRKRSNMKGSELSTQNKWGAMKMEVRWFYCIDDLDDRTARYEHTLLKKQSNNKKKKDGRRYDGGKEELFESGHVEVLDASVLLGRLVLKHYHVGKVKNDAAKYPVPTVVKFCHRYYLHKEQDMFDIFDWENMMTRGRTVSKRLRCDKRGVPVLVTNWIDIDPSSRVHRGSHVPEHPKNKQKKAILLEAVLKVRDQREKQLVNEQSKVAMEYEIVESEPVQDLAGDIAAEPGGHEQSPHKKRELFSGSFNVIDECKKLRTSADGEPFHEAQGKGPPKKVYKYICKHDGCANFVIQGGLCHRHGAEKKKKKICRHEGCTNQAQQAGLCKHHSAQKKCSHEGHGAKVKTCSVRLIKAAGATPRDAMTSESVVKRTLQVSLAGENCTKRIKDGGRSDDQPLIHEMLSNDILRKSLSFLPLKDLLCKVQRVSRSFRGLCIKDKRLLPVIPPPKYSRVDLDLEQHGKVLRKYYARFLEWHKHWLQLDTNDTIQMLNWQTTKSSALDGWFSLNPWMHYNGGNGNETSYPTPWLNKMVYDHVLYEEQKMCEESLDEEPSTFFQQRSRILDPNHEGGPFRAFFTTPLLDTVQQTVRRVNIHNFNLRTLMSKREHKNLPDHNPLELAEMNNACIRLFECYFGQGNIRVKPCRNHAADLMNGLHYNVCRKTLDGAGITQVNAKQLHLRETIAPEDNAIDIAVIAPHMYAGGPNEDSAWCFSSSLQDDVGLRRIYAGIVSTFQLQDFDEKLRHVLYANLMISTALAQVKSIGVCDNKNCTRNNVNSVEELQRDLYFLPCPGCIRKLQLCGILGPDVPHFLTRMCGVLSQEPFVGHCQEELVRLRRLIKE